MDIIDSIGCHRFDTTDASYFQTDLYDSIRPCRGKHFFLILHLQLFGIRFGNSF